MSAVKPCDRFEREGAISVEKGERLGLHYSVCPTCKAAYARYQRVIAALSFIDDAEERGDFSEDRLIARISEESKSTRRWPKVVPLSAFFGFLTLGRRAAAGPSRTALCALTALTTLLTPLPMFMGTPEGAGPNRPAMAATAITTEVHRTADLHRMTGGSMDRQGRERADVRGPATIELRRKDDTTRRVRPGTSAVVSTSSPSPRVGPKAKGEQKRRCTRKKCPNVVLEMVVNGLIGYGAKPNGRRAEARM